MGEGRAAKGVSVVGRAPRALGVGLLLAAVVVVVAVVLVVMSGDAGDEEPHAAGSRWEAVVVDANAPFLPTLANAEFARGPNRLSFTVTDQRGLSLADLEVRVRLFDIGALEVDPDPPPASTQFAQFISYAGVDPAPALHRHAEGSSLSDNARFIGVGVYVVPAFFPSAGLWGLEFSIDDGEQDPATVLFQLAVRERASAPSVGDEAIAVRTPTLADRADLASLTSDPVPEPGLYQLSIDEALAVPRPFILIFSTPAFCHSRTCGPSLEVVKSVWRANAAEIDAIHVEVFENPSEPEALRESAAFEAWRLPSEPWIFVVDGEGRIFSRYEGTITEAELRGDVAAVLTN